MPCALPKEQVLGFWDSELNTVAGVLYDDMSKEILLPLMEKRQDGCCSSKIELLHISASKWQTSSVESF
jgi:hypothetical protein